MKKFRVEIDPLDVIQKVGKARKKKRWSREFRLYCFCLTMIPSRLPSKNLLDCPESHSSSSFHTRCQICQICQRWELRWGAKSEAFLLWTNLCFLYIRLSLSVLYLQLEVVRLDFSAGGSLHNSSTAEFPPLNPLRYIIILDRRTVFKTT